MCSSCCITAAAPGAMPGAHTSSDDAAAAALPSAGRSRGSGADSTPGVGTHRSAGGGTAEWRASGRPADAVACSGYNPPSSGSDSALSPPSPPVRRHRWCSIERAAPSPLPPWAAAMVAAPSSGSGDERVDGGAVAVVDSRPRLPPHSSFSSS
eukprot:363552-Chlamydomonas_euryale.AAC.6